MVSTASIWNAPKAGDSGLDALEKADLALFFVRRMTLPEEQLGKIRKFIESGKPLIGLRTASHGVRKLEGMGSRTFLGGKLSQTITWNNLAAAKSSAGNGRPSHPQRSREGVCLRWIAVS